MTEARVSLHFIDRIPTRAHPIGLLLTVLKQTRLYRTKIHRMSNLPTNHLLIRINRIRLLQTRIHRTRHLRTGLHLFYRTLTRAHPIDLLLTEIHRTSHLRIGLLVKDQMLTEGQIILKKAINWLLVSLHNLLLAPALMTDQIEARKLLALLNQIGQDLISPSTSLKLLMV